MGKRSILLLIAFLGDTCRFLLILALFTLTFNVSSAYIPDFNAMRYGVIPYSLFLAPLAIFPLMVFFLWHDEECGGFSKLYFAGKLICVTAEIFWSVRNIRFYEIIFMLSSEHYAQIISVCSTPALVVWDALSMLFVKKAIASSKGGQIK
ncbi:MAG: hypothetical protein LBG79_02270 [Spirochaetaceae bacterium]|jgi:hypothetical protein|nr:hypothetical protein [Spirochaetaceae bacterium]